ncbi:selenium cofactor biosynthesis protein YqeC [Oceanispirochaeta sp.]|jgi:probable selenium-dependent hydroxylase accessory protein YqeC|uniref:selenium cofactor biosynthesis protein YqeC n=1 Tax=Oceanispirochaeta sp. TaxID=2035350 RepID=UPI00261286A0|nr:selenium cofactor biosynthesis protein YqeC [Oceanispirochaeta sp.]MDA3958142.1 selenium cofactor biosynthesis protein YqeC [Oceanispirochaeta sp.]
MRQRQQLLSALLNLKRGNRLALVGGGGKTSILYTLAGENLLGLGLYTTTTKMFDPTMENHPFHRLLTDWQGEDCPVPESEAESCFVAAGRIPGDNPKVQGLSNKRIESWKSLEVWPILVIEADGAAGRPVKAPREGEPVIPGSVNRVLGCIGLDALGKKIESPWVHCSDLFQKRFCRREQKRVDPECLLELIRHPEGLFQNAPKGAEKTVVFNKTDCLDSRYEIDLLLDRFRQEIPSINFLGVSLKLNLFRT